MNQKCFHWLCAVLVVVSLACVVLSARAEPPKTPQQVFDRMTNAYARCSSYQDVGEFVMIFGSEQIGITNRLPFSIRYRRPDLLRFEFAHRDVFPKNVTPDEIRNIANWPRHQCVLWNDGQQSRIYSEQTLCYWQGANLTNSIHSVGPLSMGSGVPVLECLVGMQPQVWVYDMQKCDSIREESFEGTECYVLSAKLHATEKVSLTHEYWIGKGDYFLRRRRMLSQSDDPFRSSTVIEQNYRQIRVNKWIPSRLLAFQLPADARVTTNVWSLLPEVEKTMKSLYEIPAGRRSATGTCATASAAWTNFPSLSPKRIKVVSLGGHRANVQAKMPSYIDCFPDKVVIYPGEVKVDWEQLQQPTNAVVALLERVETNKHKEYVVLLARPGSVKFFRFVRTQIGKRPIDIGKEVVDADFQVKLDGGLIQGLERPELPKPSSNPFAPYDPRRSRVSVPTDKWPVFFECRQNEVFYVDKADLDDQVTKLLSKLSPGIRTGKLDDFLKVIQGKEIGNEYYKVNPSYLLAAIMAVEPRAGKHGDSLADLNKTDCRFRGVLAQLDKRTQYIVFMLRDDSFPVFRHARKLATDAGFTTGWDLLSTNEPIKFGVGGSIPHPD
jgi:hypothetical protein